jgi:hemoglobin
MHVAAAHGMTTLHVVPAQANPHLARLGGRGAVVRLVDAFYGAMDRREDARVLRAMHAADLTETRAVLVMYLVEWLGGPRQYSAERGPPRLGRVHRPFAIDSSARLAWMACMDEALGAVCQDDDLRHDLRAAFGKLAAHLQNRHEPAQDAAAAAAPPTAPTDAQAHGLSVRNLHHPWRSR